MKTLKLAHTLDTKLSKAGARVLEIRPVSVTINLDSSEKDHDNAVLQKELEDTWKRFCIVADKWFVRDVETCVKALFVKMAQLSHSKDKNVALIDAKGIETLKSIPIQHSVKLSKRIDDWMDGFVKEADSIVTDWNKRNKKVAKIRAKRAAKVAGNILSLAKAVGEGPSGIKSAASALKSLYDNIRAATRSLEKSNKQIVKEIVKLQANIALLTDDGKMGQFARAVAKFESTTGDLTSVLDDYEKDVELLKSTEKKLGTKLRKANEDVAKGKQAGELKASQDVEELLVKIEEAHAKIDYHRAVVAEGRRLVTEAIKDHQMLTLKERATGAVKKKATKKWADAKRYFLGTSKDLENVKKVDMSAEFDTLVAGVRTDSKSVSIKMTN